MAWPTIVHASDAPPVVRGVAALLKRSAAHPRTAERLVRMKGVVGVRSSTDPQSVTVRFDRGSVFLESGVADGADVVITLDFNDPGAKPKVKGAALHPLLALGVARVLEPPRRAWQQEAADFWSFAADAPRMPSGLVVVCTDDGTQASFGRADGAYEIHGTTEALLSVFSGASILGQDVLDGKLRVVGTLEQASVLTGRSIAWAMGEGR